ncbi:hypothetical protein ACGFYA_29705 [Streptomyces sp. NPDC048305]|uniref:hypothetical protein n=1 Tax=Streptomyces sp. NPDC048305 TaxID=3365532 RepID=UPI003718A46B
MPDQPTVTTPAHRHTQSFLNAECARLAIQPGLGLAGFMIVLPIAALLAIGLGGPENSVVVLSPLVTFALPAMTMVAFWWEDWPGSSLRPGWAALVDTLLIVAAGVVLAALGQIIVGRSNLSSLFDPTPGLGDTPLFPAALPLGLTAFTAMLQLTLVWEGWPFKRLHRLPAGIAALTVSWLIALAVHYAAYDLPAPAGSGLIGQNGPFSREDIAVLLALCGSWQVWIFLVWRGWPVHRLQQRWLRILLGNLLVVAGTALTYVIVCRAAEVEPPVAIAAAAGFNAAGLVVGLLFEGAFRTRLSPPRERAATLLTTAVGGALVFAVLLAYAETLTWSAANAEAWVGHVCVNSLGLAVILHVAVCHRWPFDDKTATPQPEASTQPRQPRT